MGIDSVLSSFAISVAANIVTSLFARNGTEKEIRTAFQEAIEKWCPNEDIRRFREPDINKFVGAYVENPALDEGSLSDEMKSFLRYFEECIAAHPAAYHYLTAIKGKGYYNEVMATLQIVNTKLDAISKKIDDANPRHEELHFEAIAEINTVLEEEVVESVNVLLYGILAAFDNDIYAYLEGDGKQNIEVIIDKDSMLQVEDGEGYRPKFRDFNYNWDQERRRDWFDINPDLDFWEMFSESYMAAFQLMSIDFYDSIDALHRIIDRKTINDQLSTDEKRLLTEIIASMRAVQSVIEDHSDMFCFVVDCRLVNLRVEQQRGFEENGVKLGIFKIVYEKDSYIEDITETIAPIEMKDHLLDVYMINPDYYFKMTGYLGELFTLVREWWKLSSEN